MSERFRELVSSWNDELGNQVSVSASTVQDHLIDLWGVMDEGEPRREVERWLTETLGRDLYLVDDVSDRLDGLVEHEPVS